MAVRLTSTFYDINERQFRVDIYDNDFVGDPTEFRMDNCRLIYGASDPDDINSAIVGSRAEIGMYVHFEDTVLPTFIDDYSNGQEDRFFVEIYNITSSRVVWRGIMTPDFAGETDTAPLYTFNISAVCGLATLKKIPYHDGTAVYEGIERITKHLTIALSEIIHTDIFWDASDVFIKTAVDCWEEDMDSGATDDPLYQAALDHSAFWDYKTSGNVDKDVLSCYTVLEKILDVFNARIFQNEGVWWIEQIPYRESSPYYSRHYSKSGGYLTNAIESGANVINQTTTGAKLATVNYDFMPALKNADITYAVKMRRNYIAGTSANPNFNQEISTNGGTATMRLRFTLNYTIVDAGLGAPAGAVYYIAPLVTLKIGSYYLTRPYTIQNYTAVIGPLTWTTTFGAGVYIPIQVGQIPAGTDGVSGSVTIELITPVLPASGSSNLFDMPTDTCEMRKFNGTLVDDSLFLKTLQIVDQYLEIYDQGTPSVNEDQFLYRATNDNGASERYEKEVIIGTAGFANSVGRLKVWDGAEWADGGFWGQGIDTRDKAIGSILALHIANARGVPIRRLNGALTGNFRIHHLLNTSEGRKWMMSSCSWDIPLNSIQGTWFELTYGVDGVSNTPVKIKLLPGGSFPTVDPSSPGNGISNTSPGFHSNPAPTVLKPVSYNAISSKIDEGDTVTAIPLFTASLGNEFLAGDSVTIVHPITGVYQDFEIDTPPGIGDTSLSVVSEAAAYDFLEGSYLVIKQKPYSFSLPDGDQGEILRFNATSGVWEAYAGTTDGHVLTWDTTNGWQAEVAGGGGITALTGDVTATGPGSVAATIANNAVTFAKFQQISTDKLLGRDTAGTGNTEEIALNATLEFDGSLNLRRAALTGDVTATAGSNATTIANDAVTFAKMQNIATDKLLGRDTAGSGNTEEIGLGASLSFDGAGNIQRAALTGDVTAAVNGNATTIANDAVTYAKLQNVAANNVLLGNDNGTAQNVQELTAAEVWALLGLTGTANRFALFTTSTALSTNAAFTFTTSPDRVTFTGSAAGSGANNGILNLNTGAITGTTEFLRQSGNINGNMIMSLLNSNNSSASNHTIFQIMTGGASGSSASGDAVIQFTVSTVITHAIGVDNSDGDRFKITPNSSTPGGNANMGIIVRDNSGTGNTGINHDFPQHPLDGLGNARFELWMGTGDEWDSGNIAFGTGAGTGPSLTTITGTGNAVRVTFTTGTTPTADGDVFVLGYPFVFPTTSIVTFSARDADAAQADLYISAEDGAGCTLKVKGTLPASTGMAVNLHFWGY